MDLSRIESLYMQAIQQIKDTRIRGTAAASSGGSSAVVNSKYPGNAGALSDEQHTTRSERIALHQLYFIFGGQMRRAFALLDARAISRFACESIGGKAIDQTSKGMDVTMYRVKDGDRSYNVLLNAMCGNKFCNCEAFTMNLTTDSSSILCNHALAVLLAEAYSEIDIISIDMLKFIDISSTLC